MLGWEYPPHISGGLGTACEGLTLGLARQDVDITFVVPYFGGGERAAHMTLVNSSGETLIPGSGGEVIRTWMTVSSNPGASEKIKNIKIPAFLQPYWKPADYTEALAKKLNLISSHASESVHISEILEEKSVHAGAGHYTWDLFGEVDRFTKNVVALMADQDFDVIHAHDWMTFPAGAALSQITGKPFIAHVHSIEFDRSGDNVNARIHATEQYGLSSANHVIAVSYYTRTLVSQRYSIPLDKISVVHNGVYARDVVQNYRRIKGWPSKVVLFLGRVTFQKGPDYFVEAAAKVVPHIPDVLFVLAGSGDMLPRMVDRVRELGLGRHFYFPGFLRGQDVEEMFSLADLYVMPSVSEPFGISALEAISFDTPVVLSRQSGVSEVIGHALKTDFWDVDRLADMIINSLLHDELRQDMITMAKEEVRRLRWDASALKTIEVYQRIA